MSLTFPLAAMEISEDILVEILVRLPAYSLMRFKCVSRLWLSLISSRYFTNLFFNFSSSTKRECRRVFVYENDYMLFSSSLSNLDSTASLPTLNLDLTLPCIKNDHLKFVNPLRGLMCFRVDRYMEEGDTQIRIINFTTRQVLSLPLVESNILLGSDDYYAWNYFGYDRVNDEYKVLSIISSIDETDELRSEIQLFVLGDGTSWRNPKSLTSSPPPPHDPYGGIYINGVLYYGAWYHEKRCCVLMSFDFSSEEFNLIEIPIETRIKCDNDSEFGVVDLIHYQNQVAVFVCSCLKPPPPYCTKDLWVLEDAKKSKWSHKVLVFPFHQIVESLKLSNHDFTIRGTSRSGEIALCARFTDRNDKTTHAFYDLENNRITRGFVIGPAYHSISLFLESYLWEDVESIMYLET